MVIIVSPARFPIGPGGNPKRKEREMEIIGTTNGGYIVRTNADELSNLMGYEGDRIRRNRTDYPNEFRIGSTIPIHKMFDRLYRMANLEKELTEISAKLKAASDFVNTALPTIGRVNEEKD